MVIVNDVMATAASNLLRVVWVAIGVGVGHRVDAEEAWVGRVNNFTTDDAGRAIWRRARDRA